MFKRVRYTYQGERWHMLVVHAVTLVDCVVGLVTLGSFATELRAQALFVWFERD